MDVNKIKEEFADVVAFSQDFAPKVDDIFDKWLTAKRDFLEVFGGEPIWEYPEKVAFELSDEDKQDRVESFMGSLEDNDEYYNSDLLYFLRDNKDNFFDNVVKEDFYLQDIDFTIPKGMKIIKAFKYFYTDKDVLNEVQSIASMIIQENKIEGTLCLSVHPLDYLSISENNHNWRSCHALDGEYRGGNLSYMIDKSTIICYLKSNREEVLPRFPEHIKWNSKKWRVLLFFSTDWNMLFAGRQYPFTTGTALDFIKDKVLAQAGIGISWQKNWLKGEVEYLNEGNFHFSPISPYVPVGRELVPIRELVGSTPGSLQFNDLINSTFYDPYYTFQTSYYGSVKAISHSLTNFNIGEKVKCLRCGKHDIELTERFICNECEMEIGTCESDIFAVCPNCGETFIYDDGYCVEDEIICEYCYNHYTASCINCEEKYYTDNMNYDEEKNCFFCDNCVDLKEEKRNIGIWSEGEF